MVSLILPCQVTYASLPYPQHGLGRSSTNICCLRSAPDKLPLHQLTGPVGKALVFLPLLPARSLGSLGPAVEPSNKARRRRPSQGCLPRAISRPSPHPNAARVTSSTIPVICLGDPPYLQQTQEGLEHNICRTATETCEGPSWAWRITEGEERQRQKARPRNVQSEKRRVFLQNGKEMDASELGVLRSNLIGALSCSRFKAHW